MMLHMKSAFCATALLISMVVSLTGCQSPGPIPGGQIVEGNKYPAAKQSSQLAVQVIRDETHITATNTTSQDLAGRLWLNKWFSTEVSQWAPGQTITIDLRDVRDQYGGTMRAGGFWATKEPEKLVMAQIERPATSGTELLGLIVAE
jgi:hypothetical protein